MYRTIMIGTAIALLASPLAWGQDMLTSKERRCKAEAEIIEEMAHRRNAGISFLDSVSWLRRNGASAGTETTYLQFLETMTRLVYTPPYGPPQVWRNVTELTCLEEQPKPSQQPADKKPQTPATRKPWTVPQPDARLRY